MLSDEDVVVGNRDFLVTESVISPKLCPSELLAWMRDNRKTGDIVYRLNQGGVREAVLSEKTRIPDGKREEIRHSLGMNGKQKT